MRMLAILLFIATIAVDARASQTPLIGPAPDWVRPVELQTELANPENGSPIELLLVDQQVSLQAGERTVYMRSAIRLQTPQGLAAGNLSLPWRPDTDELTIHRLAIRRGSATIDVLASQTFTVLRRETNLESAMLDGVLTANIQPEGLEVGDIIELEVSTRTRDPVYAGQVEFTGAMWNGIPISRVHFRAQWPTSLPVRIGRTEGLPRLIRSERSGTTAIELTADNLQPITPPRDAPPRYSVGRYIDLSSFQDWADVSALLAPLYERAASIPAEGTLRTELDRIRAQSSDPIARVEAALALVQDRVRYVALAMGDGGLVPTDAATTWARRYGDCKAKTALLIALLHALEIEATPVAVHSFAGDGLNQRLPMISMFNHVIVRAVIGDRTYWLDGTRTGDRNLAMVPVHSFGWGLPLVESQAQLVRIMPAPLERPDEFMTVSVDASGGFSQPVPARIDLEIAGDSATEMAQILGTFSGERREQLLREYWRYRLRSIEPQSYTATVDPETGTVSLTVEGTTRMTWTNGRYRTSGTSFEDNPGLEREAGDDADAPFAVVHPFFTRNVHMITLPSDANGFRVEPANDVDTTIAGIEYKRRSTIDGNVVTVEATQRSVVSEFPASDAPAARTALRELSEQTVYVVLPAGYQPSQAELDAVQRATEGTAQDFLRRGNILLDSGRFPEAVAQFDRAIAIEPSNQWALASRGITHVWQNDFVKAEADLAAAAAINDRNPVIYRARGLMALQNGKFDDAVEAFTTAHDIDRANNFALEYRAQAYSGLGKHEQANADLSTVIDRQPSRADLYARRASALRRLGRNDEAIEQARMVVTANPDNANAHLIAAGIYDANSRQTDAMRELDLSLAQRGTVEGYLFRAEMRALDDAAGRRADIDQAIALEPNSVSALAMRAELEADAGNFDAAIAAWDSAIAAAPDSMALKVYRGVAYLRAGLNAEADRDLTAARGNGEQAFIFNNICWEKAKASIALDSALDDCNMALRLQPDSAAYLDSRGLVYLQMGRLEEAIADFDRALAISPQQAASLFGRAVAHARQGNLASARADMMAAEREAPNIRRRYAHYGIALPISE